MEFGEAHAEGGWHDLLALPQGSGRTLRPDPTSSSPTFSISRTFGVAAGGAGMSTTVPAHRAPTRADDRPLCDPSHRRPAAAPRLFRGAAGIPPVCLHTAGSRTDASGATFDLIPRSRSTSASSPSICRSTASPIRPRTGTAPDIAFTTAADIAIASAPCGALGLARPVVMGCSICASASCSTSPSTTPRSSRRSASRTRQQISSSPVLLLFAQPARSTAAPARRWSPA